MGKLLMQHFESPCSLHVPRKLLANWISWRFAFSDRNSIKLHFSHNPCNWIRSSSKRRPTRALEDCNIKESNRPFSGLLSNCVKYSHTNNYRTNFWGNLIFSFSGWNFLNFPNRLAQRVTTQEALESFIALRCNVTRRKVSLDCNAIPSSP